MRVNHPHFQPANRSLKLRPFKSCFIAGFSANCEAGFEMKK